MCHAGPSCAPVHGHDAGPASATHTLYAAAMPARLDSTPACVRPSICCWQCWGGCQQVLLPTQHQQGPGLCCWTAVGTSQQHAPGQRQRWGHPLRGSKRPARNTRQEQPARLTGTTHTMMLSSPSCLQLSCSTINACTTGRVLQCHIPTSHTWPHVMSLIKQAC